MACPNVVLLLHTGSTLALFYTPAGQRMLMFEVDETGGLFGMMSGDKRADAEAFDHFVWGRAGLEKGVRGKGVGERRARCPEMSLPQ